MSRTERNVSSQWGACRCSLSGMIWRFGPSPGTLHLAASADTPAEWDTLMAQEAHVFDGQRATLSVHECDRETLWLRWTLDEPFRMPPTVLHFEDHAEAERVAATGWCVHHGGLHRAIWRAPGEVTLDRLDPAATYPPVRLPELVVVTA
jgi:hypothetical protein